MKLTFIYQPILILRRMRRHVPPNWHNTTFLKILTFIEVSKSKSVNLLCYYIFLQLSRKVHLGKKVLIKPIKLPTHEVKLKEKKKCSVAGWGFDQTGGEVVDDLREVDVPVINLQKCRQEWSKIPPNVICAGGYSTKKGICQVCLYPS